MAPPDGAAAGRRGKRRRLTRSADFDRAFRRGRSYAGRHLVLHAFPRPVEETAGAGDSALPRLGVSVGRRVGGAVERNRVKRLLREAFWATAPSLPPGHDFVLVARPGAEELAVREGALGFEAALRALLAEAGLERPADERQEPLEAAEGGGRGQLAADEERPGGAETAGAERPGAPSEGGGG